MSNAEVDVSMDLIDIDSDSDPDSDSDSVGNLNESSTDSPNDCIPKTPEGKQFFLVTEFCKFLLYFHNPYHSQSHT